MEHRATPNKANAAFSSDPRGSSFVTQLWQTCAADTARRVTADAVELSDAGQDVSPEGSVLSRVGTVVADRWHVDRLIGVGGMGAVYAATHRNGQRVALKFLRHEFSGVAEVRERFLAEASIANRLKHPGISRMSDDGEAEDGSLYLVMELLEGHTLEEHVKLVQCPVPVERVATILTTLLDVLEVAHNAGVLHRDIKPANIFLCDDGSVRLLDFGVARTDDARSYTTMAGVTLGTPTYMSPEQAGGRWEEVDGRSDLFALAATAYALLTGVNIRQAETFTEELVLAMTKQVPSIGELRPDLSAGWIAVIDCALRFSKEERFTSAAAMRAALATCTEPRVERSTVNPGETLTLISGKLAVLPSGKASIRRDGAVQGLPAPKGLCDPTLNVLGKHSIAAWQSPAGAAPGRTSNRWWGPALVAALCLAPAIATVRLNDPSASDWTAPRAAAVVADRSVAEPSIVEPAPAQPVAAVVVPEPRVIEPAVAAPPAPPPVTAPPRDVEKAAALGQPPEIAKLTPEAVGASPIIPVQLAVRPIRNAPQLATRGPFPAPSADVAQGRLATELNQRLNATSAAALTVSVAPSAHPFDPLERRN